MMEHNTADEKVVKDMAEKAENDRIQLLEDLREILKLPGGRRFFKQIFRGVETISMTGNSWTHFNEGQRNASKKIWKDVVEANASIAARIATEVYKEGVKTT